LSADLTTRRPTSDAASRRPGWARPIVAYLAIVVLGVWGFYAAEHAARDGDVLRAATAAAAEFLGAGAMLLAFAVILLTPALTLTIEAVHRFGAAARGTRAVLGATSWAGWGLLVAITLAVASRLVLVPEILLGDLGLLGAMGAGFALLGLDGPDRRAGRTLTLLAVAVAAIVVVASSWMAGHWGAAA
jgi:hypothetical protein